MGLITSVLILVAAGIALANILRSKKSSDKEQAPGPRPWPLIGNLPYIGKFKDLLDAFTNLKEEYGNVASIKLGVHNAVVICGLQNFREVLVDNAHLFDARPAFKRYYLLFGGNKDNSLAFADGNDAHHKHRSAIAFHTFAKNGTANFENLEDATTEHVFRLVDELKNEVKTDNKIDVHFKLAETVSAIFMKYFANIEVDPQDQLYKEMVTSFDLVFQEVNQGCIGDVLPFLMPFINKSEYVELSHKIREFTEKRCFEPVLKQRSGEILSDENNNQCKEEAEKPSNVINALLDLVDEHEDVNLEHVFYAFEDILGGHSAVSNSMIRILAQLAKNPEAQQKIRQEVQQQASGFPKMTDRLTYTEAAIWEAFRFISSPIVPHKATVDTTINGFPVKKDTVVFFNNMDMNFSSELWESPEKFSPERFISQGRILKPEYFLPFSTGKRNCLGYKLAINVSKVIVANMCQNFEIQLDPFTDYEMERGIIAVGRGKSFPFLFKPLEE